MDKDTKIVVKLMVALMALIVTFNVCVFLEWRTRIGELAECQAWRLVLASRIAQPTAVHDPCATSRGVSMATAVEDITAKVDALVADKTCSQDEIVEQLEEVWEHVGRCLETIDQEE